MLLERVDQELKDAMRAQDKKRLNVLRMLKSQLKNREIGPPERKLEDPDVVAVVQTLIKQRHDAAGQYTAGGRPELARIERDEIVVLESFLPKQLSDDELGRLVQEAVAETSAKGPKDMGAVMKAVLPKIAGRAEGKRVSEAVKSGLAKL